MAQKTDKEFLEYWEKKKRLGRKQYALRDGLKWALATFPFVVLFQFLVLKAEDKQNLWISIGVELVALVITGFILYYFLFWRLYDKKYHQLKNKPIS